MYVCCFGINHLDVDFRPIKILILILILVSMGYYDRTLDFPANPDFVFCIIMLKIIIIFYNAHWTTTDEWLDPVERF